MPKTHLIPTDTEQRIDVLIVLYNDQAESELQLNHHDTLTEEQLHAAALAVYMAENRAYLNIIRVDEHSQVQSHWNPMDDPQNAMLIKYAVESPTPDTLDRVIALNQAHQLVDEFSIHIHHSTVTVQAATPRVLTRDEMAGYGWIAHQAKADDSWTFVRYPDPATAEEYIEDGDPVLDDLCQHHDPVDCFYLDPGQTPWDVLNSPKNNPSGAERDVTEDMILIGQPETHD